MVCNSFGVIELQLVPNLERLNLKKGKALHHNEAFHGKMGE